MYYIEFSVGLVEDESSDNCSYSKNGQFLIAPDIYLSFEYFLENDS